ncbi:TPA: phage major capsid protein [Vibrio parahaemolyticus]|nr:phage major capsid protein [Vibrio parahaemolyticus]EKZ9248949.1 phage major capsid protein [Vibrio parahaemolyticus]ELA6677394.1 phage major capsid protein [Vibrio parahaemolyticus]ELI6470705.1 phage major capsid protein [Vibrio parahaemolyticus]
MQNETKSIDVSIVSKHRTAFDIKSEVRSYDSLKSRKVLNVPFIDLVKESSALYEFGAEFIEDDNFKTSNWFPTFESDSDEAQWLATGAGVTKTAVWSVKGVNYSALTVAIGYKIGRSDVLRGPNGWNLKDAVKAGTAARFGRGITNAALVGDGTNKPKGLTSQLRATAIKGTTSKTITRAQFAEAIKAIADSGFEVDQVAVITSSADQEKLLSQDDGDGKAWRFNEPNSPSNQTLFGIPAASSDQLKEGEYIIGLFSYLKVIHESEATSRSVTDANDAETIYGFMTCDAVTISNGAFKMVDNSAATGGA